MISSLQSVRLIDGCRYAPTNLRLFRRACLETRQKASVAIEKFEVFSENLQRSDLLQCIQKLSLGLHTFGACHEGHGHFPERKPVAVPLIAPGETIAAS